MDENKFAQLIKNDNFIDGLLGCSSREEMRQIFENYGQAVSEEELDYLIAAIEKASQIAIDVCSDKSMDVVAGGTTFDALEDSLTRKLLFKLQKTDFDPI